MIKYSQYRTKSQNVSIFLSADDEKSNVLKRSAKMLAHVLARWFISRLPKRFSHYAP